MTEERIYADLDPAPQLVDGLGDGGDLEAGLLPLILQLQTVSGLDVLSQLGEQLRLLEESGVLDPMLLAGEVAEFPDGDAVELVKAEDLDGG